MSDHNYFADHAHVSPDLEYRETPGSSYEHTDADTSVIFKFGAWLLVSAVVVHFGMWGMFALFVKQRAEPAATQPYPVAVGQEPRLPAAPRLQQAPVVEMYEFRLKEDEALRSYGWVDKAGGRVRIPVSEAMRLTVERGLPARAAAPDAPAPDPALIPADSSSGRTMERRR